uniref:Myb/SANT-like domain-containing protein n=1 Tax=Oryza meridionalis TaxID=40149 RepID=A0A0E0DQ84_9ORYZ
MLRYYKEKIQAEGRQFIFKEVHYEECAKQINEKYHRKFISCQVYHKFHKLKAQWKVIMEAKNLSGANFGDVEKRILYNETEVVRMNNAKDKKAKYINVPIRCSSSKRPKGSKTDKGKRVKADDNPILHITGAMNNMSDTMRFTHVTHPNESLFKIIDEMVECPTIVRLQLQTYLATHESIAAMLKGRPLDAIKEYVAQWIVENYPAPM